MMRSKTIALAAVLVAGSFGVALAQNAPAGQSESTVSKPEPHVQNPMVNPNAAGTQRQWHGYGSSSSATANPAPAGSGVTDETAARQRLGQLGYQRITGLRRLANGGWEAEAQQGNRQVRVSLDSNGVVQNRR